MLTLLHRPLLRRPAAGSAPRSVARSGLTGLTGLTGLAGLAGVLLVAAPAVAQPGSGPGDPVPPAADLPSAAGSPATGLPEAGSPMTFSLDLAAGHDFERDMDAGGDYSVNRFEASASADWRIDDRTGLSLSLGWRHDDYDFGGTGGVASLDPWEAVNGFDISLTANHRLNDRWTLIGGPTLSFDAEDGADLADGATVGGLFGAAYSVNPNLVIGPGFFIRTELEDDVRVIPFLFLRYRIRDGLSFVTGESAGPTGGAGAALRWELDEDLAFLVGGRFDSRRFRLDDQGAVPDGVGEVEGFALAAILSWTPRAGSRVDFYGGFRLEGQVTVFDDDGVELIDTDSDPTPFLGVRGRIEF